MTFSNPPTEAKLALRPAADREVMPATPSGPKHGATVSFVYNELREDILHNKLGPGYRLVENDLTRRFGVSRGPVREALRRLAGEGLIEHIPNRGGMVCQHSDAEARELFEIRVELETLAARSAAQNGSPSARAAFSSAVDPIFAETPRDASTYLAQTARFHDAIMTLSGNASLKVLMDRLQSTAVMGQIVGRWSAETILASVREYRAIADAIFVMDPDAAAAGMRAHLDRAGAEARLR